MLRYSGLHNRFVRHDGAEKEEKSAIAWLRAKAARFGKTGNAEAQYFADALAAQIERCAVLEMALCEIPLPETKRKRGRPPTKLKAERRKGGRPIEWTHERISLWLAEINVGRRMLEEKGRIRISDSAALEELLRSKGKPITKSEKKKIRALTKVLSAKRQSVRKLVP